MKHIISILMSNETGALSRVCDLFSGRGYPIESLSVAPIINQNFSKATIVTSGDEKTIEQIVKHVNSLIPVLKVVDVKNDNKLVREFLMCKVLFSQKTRADVLHIANLFKANVLEVSSKYAVLEVCGSQSELATFVELLKPIGIKEMAKSGSVALCSATSL